MTKPRFAKRSACVAIMAAALAASAARGQQAGPAAEPAPKAGKLIRTGDVLSGELETMRVRHGKEGKPVATYQITSEPRRLPPPSGLCNLETGPETFEIITRNDAQVAQLRALVGKEISIKVDEIACAQDAGEMSEAVVSKWRVVTTR
ncbi:hypothetical protein [Bradyrhizobium sp.]|uniref:hypothetical protein n=1 Tax=Bradyrhizobium sp. TaxID=376 RepID=UPI003C640FC5